MKRSLYRKYGLGQKNWIDSVEEFAVKWLPYVLTFILGAFFGLLWAFLQK